MVEQKNGSSLFPDDSGSCCTCPGLPSSWLLDLWEKNNSIWLSNCRWVFVIYSENNSNLYNAQTRVWANSGRSWRTGKPGLLQSMGSQSQTRLSDWTTTKITSKERSWTFGSGLSPHLETCCFGQTCHPSGEGLGSLYSFPIIAVTNYHKFRGLETTNLFSYSSRGKFCPKIKVFWGKERVGRIKSSTDIYTLSCVKQIASGELLHKRELSLLPCDELEGWNGGVWGEGSGGGGYMYTYSWFTLIRSRNQHDIVLITS